MNKTLDETSRTIAAKAILSREGQVVNTQALRAMGRAAFFAASEDEEPEILVGLALAARDTNNVRMKRALNLALKFLAMPTVGNDEPQGESDKPSFDPEETSTGSDDSPDSEVRCEWDSCKSNATIAVTDVRENRWLVCAVHETRGRAIGTFKPAGRFDTEPSPPKHEHEIPGIGSWRSATKAYYGGAPLRRGERVLVWPTARAVSGRPDEPVVGFCAGIDNDGDPVLRSLEVMPDGDDFYFSKGYVDTLDNLRPGTWTRLPW